MNSPIWQIPFDRFDLAYTHSSAATCNNFINANSCKFAARFFDFSEASLRPRRRWCRRSSPVGPYHERWERNRKGNDNETPQRMVSLPGGDVALGRSKSFRFDPWSKESGILAQHDNSGKRFERWILHDSTVATTVFQMVMQHCFLAWTCQMYWNYLELGPQNNWFLRFRIPWPGMWTGCCILVSSRSGLRVETWECLHFARYVRLCRDSQR